MELLRRSQATRGMYTPWSTWPPLLVWILGLLHRCPSVTIDAWIHCSSTWAWNVWHLQDHFRRCIALQVQPKPGEGESPPWHAAYIWQLDSWRICWKILLSCGQQENVSDKVNFNGLVSLGDEGHRIDTRFGPGLMVLIPVLALHWYALQILQMPLSLWPRRIAT